MDNQQRYQQIQVRDDKRRTDNAPSSGDFCEQNCILEVPRVLGFWRIATADIKRYSCVIPRKGRKLPPQVGISAGSTVSSESQEFSDRAGLPPLMSRDTGVRCHHKHANRFFKWGFLRTALNPGSLKSSRIHQM